MIARALVSDARARIRSRRPNRLPTLMPGPFRAMALPPAAMSFYQHCLCLCSYSDSCDRSGATSRSQLQRTHRVRSNIAR